MVCSPRFYLEANENDSDPGSGVLSCLDGYMNIALEQTEEHVNGTVTNRYGDAFIRGNNGSTVPFALLLADDFSHSTLHISCRTLIKHCHAYCKIVKLHSDLHISNASVGLRPNGRAWCVLHTTVSPVSTRKWAME